MRSWYQRRIRVLPGVHLNLSRSGVGVSIGERGAHVGWTARGHRYASLSVPGTRWSWRGYGRCELCGPGRWHVEGWVVVMGLAMVLVVAIALATAGR